MTLRRRSFFSRIAGAIGAGFGLSMKAKAAAEPVPTPRSPVIDELGRPFGQSCSFEFRDTPCRMLVPPRRRIMTFSRWAFDPRSLADREQLGVGDVVSLDFEPGNPLGDHVPFVGRVAGRDVVGTIDGFTETFTVEELVGFEASSSYDYDDGSRGSYLLPVPLDDDLRLGWTAFSMSTMFGGS